MKYWPKEIAGLKLKGVSTLKLLVVPEMVSDDKACLNGKDVLEVTSSKAILPKVRWVDLQDTTMINGVAQLENELLHVTIEKIPQVESVVVDFTDTWGRLTLNTDSIASSSNSGQCQSEANKRIPQAAIQDSRLLVFMEMLLRQRVDFI